MPEVRTRTTTSITFTVSFDEDDLPENATHDQVKQAAIEAAVAACPEVASWSLTKYAPLLNFPTAVVTFTTTEEGIQ